MREELPILQVCIQTHTYIYIEREREGGREYHPNNTHIYIERERIPSQQHTHTYREREYHPNHTMLCLAQHEELVKRARG